MVEFGNIKRGFALEEIDNSMVSIIKKRMHQWFSDRQ